MKKPKKTQNKTITPPVPWLEILSHHVEIWTANCSPKFQELAVNLKTALHLGNLGSAGHIIGVMVLPNRLEDPTSRPSNSALQQLIQLWNKIVKLHNRGLIGRPA